MTSHLIHSHRGRCLFRLWLLLVLVPGMVQAQVRLNEILADNRDTIENGEAYPDYIEIYNATASPLNLGGVRLTDDFMNPSKYIIPQGTTIDAFGYLVVWADDRTNAPGLHTGFGLDNDGEQLFMFNASGFFLDLIEFGIQLPDRSIGRSPDGSGPWGLNVPTPGLPNQVANTVGPERIFINEWAANNNDGADDDWFELYNATNFPVNLAGLVISDASTNYPMPALSFIDADEFLQIFASDDPERGADHVPFKLSSSNGETLTLTQSDGFTIIDTVSFGAQQLNVSEGRLPDTAPPPFRRFPTEQRTPGRSNFLLITNVVVNELLSHTDPPYEDAVEFHNPTPAPVDIGNFWMSDERSRPRKFRIPPNTIIPPFGYIVFYEFQGVPGSGFNPGGQGAFPDFTFNSARGDTVNLFSGDASGNLTGFTLRQTFNAVENGTSFGRVVTQYDTNFVRMASKTFGVDNPTTLFEFRQGTGRANSLPLIGPIVVSEVMYHPPDIILPGQTNDNTLDEFIELKNITAQNVRLFHPVVTTNTWRLRNAVDYDFPQNTIVPPNSYLLVVGFDPNTNAVQLAAFRSLYNVSANVPIFGPWNGRLGNGGETIELRMPDTPQGPQSEDPGLVPYVDIERIRYRDDPPWATPPDGLGPSLNRINTLTYGNAAENWASGTPSPGADFIPNQPPVLTFIPDLVTNEFRMITITNTATDPDLPAQNLTFHLEAAAHPGATLSSNGVFFWWPKEAEGPGSYDFTVRVTDDGLGSLSDTQTFSIQINELNRRPLLSMANQYTKVGQPLSFSPGLDTDIPANNLTYSLLTPPPSGLTLDTNSGTISWTPVAGQGPAVHTIRLRVIDDGAGMLSNEADINIWVFDAAETLLLQNFVKVGNELNIIWDAEVGQSYTVRYTDSLVAPVTWSVLQSNVLAQFPQMSVIDTTVDCRFYQILRE